MVKTQDKHKDQDKVLFQHHFTVANDRWLYSPGMTSRHKSVNMWTWKANKYLLWESGSNLVMDIADDSLQMSANRNTFSPTKQLVLRDIWVHKDQQSLAKISEPWNFVSHKYTSQSHAIIIIESRNQCWKWKWIC